MKKIKLTQNKEALIDDEDFDLVSKYKWFYHQGYATKKIKTANGWRTLDMHRFIMNAKNGDEIDHANGKPLDNRKSNLRFCSHRENMHNSRKPKNNTSGFKGVYFNKNAKKWYAQIKINYKQIYLGLFSNIEDAVMAYSEASKKYHGKFGKTD